mgnify:CR=1 FL=1
MKKISCLIIALGFMVSLSAQDFQKGIWLTNKGNTKIETYQKEGAWYGKVIDSDNPKAKIGNDILRDFKQVDGQWKGKLFVAKRGKLVDAVIEPKEDNLTITISRGFSSKTLVWKSVR